LSPTREAGEAGGVLQDPGTSPAPAAWLLPSLSREECGGHLEDPSAGLALMLLVICVSKLEREWGHGAGPGEAEVLG
jgi:hypothetical protein